MQVIVHEKLVGAVCSVPCRMAFPPQELLWLFGFESIDIGFPLRDDSEGLPHKFVGTAITTTLPGLPLDLRRSKHALHSVLHLSDENAAT
jgi:hypothetical protein